MVDPGQGGIDVGPRRPRSDLAGDAERVAGDVVAFVVLCDGVFGVDDETFSLILWHISLVLLDFGDLILSTS